mmetsp:Transcript_11286/g.20029  ORF Transcript_11286/g.20029 Transcript_11286/m.20029 type:complete len:216 (+) Transcript_11286:55-702(+)
MLALAHYYRLHFLVVTDFPNIPRPPSSIETVDAAVAEYIPLPTRSVGSLVAATPSESNLALTIKSSPLHQTSLLAFVAPSTMDAPSGVKFCDVKVNSYGNVGLANLAESTGGGLPLLPSNIALGTLFGRFGLAVTYIAALGPIVSSSDCPDCRVAVPRIYIFSSGSDAETTVDIPVISNVEAAATTARREGIGTGTAHAVLSVLGVEHVSWAEFN